MPDHVFLLLIFDKFEMETSNGGLKRVLIYESRFTCMHLTDLLYLYAGNMLQYVTSYADQLGLAFRLWVGAMSIGKKL